MNPYSFSKLESLNLAGNKFLKLHSFRKLFNLSDLNLSKCELLWEIPERPQSVLKLDASDCKSLVETHVQLCSPLDISKFRVSFSDSKISTKDVSRCGVCILQDDQDEIGIHRLGLNDSTPTKRCFADFAYQDPLNHVEFKLGEKAFEPCQRRKNTLYFDNFK
ncbi:hypothetical protein FEM48_Zijuj05G0173500 [Ziziphus jujuba var. spinosa]|uniref:Uncharacterized protein n=1 Tax=Ziziphus jujuba var. spinosa TaxID=714518 RepID=A0A978VG47_ZIZJJ|nr:hypothetical protein FEM48_Zijuj05G0173500 [Ziziphus jujuba var. spinosa]